MPIDMGRWVCSLPSSKKKCCRSNGRGSQDSVTSHQHSSSKLTSEMFFEARRCETAPKRSKSNDSKDSVLPYPSSSSWLCFVFSESKCHSDLIRQFSFRKFEPPRAKTDCSALMGMKQMSIMSRSTKKKPAVSNVALQKAPQESLCFGRFCVPRYTNCPMIAKIIQARRPFWIGPVDRRNMRSPRMSWYNSHTVYVIKLTMAIAVWQVSCTLFLFSAWGSGTIAKSSNVTGIIICQASLNNPF